jgi:hypothetical protein
MEGKKNRFETNLTEHSMTQLKENSMTFNDNLNIT